MLIYIYVYYVPDTVSLNDYLVVSNANGNGNDHRGIPIMVVWYNGISISDATVLFCEMYSTSGIIKC